MKKQLIGLLLAATVGLTMAGCSSKGPAPAQTGGAATNSGTVTASGSTALLPLVTAAKEQFEARNENATINVSGGGSFTGLTQVAQGNVNIGNSDVEATADIAASLVDHKVAIAPFMIVVNKDVTATDVTKAQLAKILSGQITNWKDVGGTDAKITVVTRSAASGSRATVVKTVLAGQDNIARDALVQDSNGKVFDVVSTTGGAIGYIDAPYFKADKLNALKLDGVSYSVDAVTQGKWPIWAYEHMYTKGEASGVAKAFLDYMTSADFQNSNLEKLGFIPVSKMAGK